MIDAWVEEGYSLRHQLVNLLISSDQEESQNNEHSESLMKLERLIGDAKKEKEVSDTANKEISDNFVSSLKRSVKGGLSVGQFSA